MKKLKELNKRIEENEAVINKKNEGLLELGTCIAVILSLLLLIASYFVKSIEHNRALYTVTLFLFLINYGIAHIFYKKHEKIVLLSMYFFLILTFGFGLILGIYMTPNGAAVTFCVLFLTLPQLFIDKFLRMELLQVVVAFVFCYLTHQVKPGNIASLDTVNVFSFLFISIPLNYGVLANKVNDIENQKKILWQNERDGLTQIYNKDTAISHIKNYMENSKALSALLVIDIDEFKEVNDQYGHRVGDQAIQFVANMLSRAVRSRDVVGRFGGDEFFMFMQNVKDEESAVKKANEIRNLVCDRADDFELDRKVKISISIGLAMFPGDGDEFNELFENADRALYHSKKLGKNRVTCYHPEDYEE